MDYRRRRLVEWIAAEIIRTTGRYTRVAERFASNLICGGYRRINGLLDVMHLFNKLNWS